MKRHVSVLRAMALSVALALSLALVGCSSGSGQGATDVGVAGEVGSGEAGADATGQQDVVILFTGDVHCGISDNIGYAGLAAYVGRMEQITPHVTLVDTGDAVQGDVIGMVSEGEYLVDVMNEVGYDLAILGNHEFDFGIEQLGKLMDMAEYTYLSSNITYHGTEGSPLQDIPPYVVMEYGDISVGFVGATTVEPISSPPIDKFMENGELVYDFAAGEEGARMYAAVQDAVDACHAEGADYVVLLAHLGDPGEYSPYSSVDVAQNTQGIDVVLDGHAHNVISCRMLVNKAGEDVLLSSTGTKLANIGQLVISANGTISVGLVSGYDDRDSEIEAYLEDIVASYEEDMNRVVATSDVSLSIADESGIRMVRSRETAIGNLVADAYRAVSGADIAMVNGGGIRADLPAGDITYGDVIAVHPFGNMLCVVEATGQEILDCLEVASRSTRDVAVENGLAAGEEGSFQHVSGMRYTIDTSVETPVILDETGMLVDIQGERRVKDVQVQSEAGEWADLDPAATYTLASHNYLIKEAGGGVPVFQDNVLLADETMLDYQVLVTYIVDHLQGQLGAKYSDVEGRIAVL